MNTMMTLSRSFHGQNITTLTYKGRPCWIAKEIGQALGYAEQGKRFVKKISIDWNAEFINEKDYLKLSDKELKEFKTLIEPGTDSVPGRTSHIVLLFESGLHLALAKTNKPIGKELRRFLVDEVLPQLVRDGVYLPARTIENGNLVFKRDESERAERLRHLVMEEAREARLNRELDLRFQDLELRKCERKVEGYRSLVEVLHRHKHVSDDIIVTYEIVASELATEENLSALKPRAEDTWKSPTQIAERLGVTPHKVGCVITQLGLRGNIDGTSKAIINKAKDHDRTVISYVYSPLAVKQIEAAILKTN